jgi:Photosynthetic reaction centre cytochrome C subunit
MTDIKKLTTIVVLAILMLLGIAATEPPAKKFTNLKILPQDISEQQLDSIMNAFNKALKVSCDFCHIKANDLTGIAPATDNLNYAADTAMKEEARKMMLMTIAVNKNYFHALSDSNNKKEDHQLNVVTCNTCHRGNPYPAHE